MQHFANFGIVKQSNKQLKNMHELKINMNTRRNEGLMRPLGETSAQAVKNIDKYPKQKEGYEKFFKDVLLDNKKEARRLRGIEASPTTLLRTQDPLTQPLGNPEYLHRSNLKVGASAKKDWSEIRKTDDTAASSSGFLGFRNDPYKGYGGMMEEAIPRAELIPKGVYRSRLTRKLTDG